MGCPFRCPCSWTCRPTGESAGKTWPTTPDARPRGTGSCRRRSRRSARRRPPHRRRGCQRAGSPVAERADFLLDAGIKRGDLRADPVGVVEHHVQDRRVMIGEKSPQRLFKLGGLFLRARPLASCASARGSRCPAIKASIIARPVTPCSSESTDEILIWASSSSFSMRCCSRVRSAPGRGGSG